MHQNVEGGRESRTSLAYPANMLLPDNRGGVGPRPGKVGPLERLPLRLPLRLTFVVGPIKLHFGFCLKRGPAFV